MEEKYKETILREINQVINYIAQNFYLDVNELELKLFIKSDKKIPHIIQDVINDQSNLLSTYIKNKIDKYNINDSIHKLSYEMYHRDVGMFYFLFYCILKKYKKIVKNIGVIDYFDNTILSYLDERVEIFRPHFYVADGGLLMKYLMRSVQGSLVVSSPMKIHAKILEEVLKIISKEELLDKSSIEDAYKIAKKDFPLSILFLVHLAYSSEIMVSKRGLI